MCIYTALSPVYKLAAPTNSLPIHFTKSRPTSGIMWSTKQIENNLKKTDLLDFDSDRLRTDFPENNPSECLRTDLRNKNKTTFSNISSQSSISDSLLMENINMLECQVVLEDVLSSGSTVKFQMLNGNPDKPHSVPSHQPVERDFLESIVRKDPIAWPKMSDDESWAHLDNVVADLLFGASSVFDRLNLLENSIYTQASLLFGIKEKSRKNLKGLNRRAQHSIALVKQKNILKSQLNSSLDHVTKATLQPLFNDVMHRLRRMRRGENNRKKRWKIKQANKAFLNNPYNAGKSVLDPDCHASLKCDESTLDNYKKNILFDDKHQCPLPPLNGLPPSPILKSKFVSKQLSYDDLIASINSKRNASSPGLNMIPYKVYKKCPRILSFLFKIFKSCVKLNCVPIQWRIASEVYIPKVKPPNNSTITDFRPIALLNVEGKIFFSLISKKLEDHIIKKNEIINKSIQKGCMAKVPGCWEHMSVVWNELKSAENLKSDIAAVWLDVANAYGSIPHQLILFALRRYGVSESIINLIQSYYSGLWSKSFSQTAPSSWHQHLKGIFTGCTISIILFLSGINVVIEFICADILQSVSGPPVKAFMDDIFLKADSVSNLQVLLNRASIVLNWAHMFLKTSKSRSLVIKDGKVIFDRTLSITQGEKTEIIPSIHCNPIKFLGRTISFDLSDKNQIEAVSLALSTALNLIDKSKHKGIHKIWILQHLLIPRLRWPLMIYEFPVSKIIKLEQKVSTFLRKWLRIHRSTTNICLYSSVSPCPLPLSQLTSVLKSSKVSGQLLLRDSADPCVSNVNIKLNSGKWTANDAINNAEAKLEFKKILGYHQSNRAGLGSVVTQTIPPKQSRDYRNLVSTVSNEFDQDHQLAQSVQLSLQGQWNRWCDYVKLDLSWKSLLAMPQSLLSFCLGATYDTLPSPSNLSRWQLTSAASCTLCQKSVCTAAHILGACKVALNQGRYTFRHDAVLEVLVTAIEHFLRSYFVAEEPKPKIKFVKAGAKIKKTKRKPNIGVLHSAPDWKILSDLGTKMIFPPFIAVTQLRPDLLIISESKKLVVIIELTCPCEENMEIWHQKKFLKYDSLCTAAKANGWSVQFFAVEVGARGYCAMTMKSCLFRLGFENKLIKSTLKSMSLASLTSSFQIWLSRDSHDWNPHKTFSHQPSKYVAPLKIAKEKEQIETRSFSSSKNHKEQHKNNCGLMNKGNTCYANASLQALSTLDKFWSSFSSQSATSSLFVSSFVKLMSLLKTSRNALDPSQFLKRLDQLIKKAGNKSFKLFQQQDAAEVLSYILEELCSESIHAMNLLSTYTRQHITCTACQQISTSEESTTLFQLPVSDSVQNSFDSFLKPDSVDNFYCNICSKHQPAIIDHEFSRIGNYLILQLKRFTGLPNAVRKNIQKVVCTPQLVIPVIVDTEIKYNMHFNLVATINHTGNLKQGHYTAYIKNASTSWSHCNDSAVLPTSKSMLDNTSSYLFFFEAN